MRPALCSSGIQPAAAVVCTSVSLTMCRCVCSTQRRGSAVRKIIPMGAHARPGFIYEPPVPLPRAVHRCRRGRSVWRSAPVHCHLASPPRHTHNCTNGLENFNAEAPTFVKKVVVCLRTATQVSWTSLQVICYYCHHHSSTSEIVLNFEISETFVCCDQETHLTLPGAEFAAVWPAVRYID